MNCAIHTDVPAAAYCRTCGKALCETCKRDVKGVIYCEDCIAAHVQGTMPAAQSGAIPPPPPRPHSAPSPGLAAMLALIPGVGAMYNGQFRKGVAHVIMFAILIGIASIVGPIMVPVFFFFFFYLMFDAYKTARAKELGQPLPDPFGMSRFWGIDEEGANWSSAGIPIGAVVLIALGCLFLLHNLGVFYFGWAGKLWPLILIAIGVGLYARHQSTCANARSRYCGLMWPAVLVTLGVLFLLDQFGVRGFHSTWPLLLIVIGLVKVLQTSRPAEGHSQGNDPNTPGAPALTNGTHNSGNQGVPNA